MSTYDILPPPKKGQRRDSNNQQPIRFQQPERFLQGSEVVFHMFKNVERQNDIKGSIGKRDRFQGPSHEFNPIGGTCTMRRIYIKSGNDAVLAGKLQ